MSTKPGPAKTVLLTVLASVLAVTACREPGMAPSAWPSFAQGGKSSAVTVTAATPAYGHRGDVSEVVTITGSGFQANAQAWWDRNGAPDPKITVLSTQYVSSTQLVATINIASDASLSLYDLTVVNGDRTKGIGTFGTGTQLFEVTQAVLIPGTQNARGVNDSGEIVGTILLKNGRAEPSYFSVASGLLQAVDSATAAFDISPRGNAIVGRSPYPTLWTRAGAVGTAWQATALPRDPTSTDGNANALVADSITGQVVLIGGRERFSAPKNAVVYKPRLWIWQAATSSWLRVVLPAGSSTAQGQVVDLSAGGVAVGDANARAAVWESDGAGGYVLTFISGSGGRATGITSDGTRVSGVAGGAAVYWQRTGGTWSAPILLPGGCAEADGIADSGRMILSGCPDGNVSVAAIIDPPYEDWVRLGGFGPKGTVGIVSGISRSGQYATAQASAGVYWKLF